MKIELFYLEGCPNLRPTMDRLRHVLHGCGLLLPIMEIQVDDDDATELQFLGSPTIRIDGVDIEPSARHRTGFGTMCRTYRGSGIPSEDLIRTAIAEAEGNGFPSR